MGGEQDQKVLVSLAEEGQLAYDPYKIFETSLHHKSPEEPETLYFLGMMLRRKHAKATRKVASFGLAFGSK